MAELEKQVQYTLKLNEEEYDDLVNVLAAANKEKRKECTALSQKLLNTLLRYVE